MATYYKEPYKMYYEKLVNAKEMPSFANRVNNGAENLSTTIENFKSQVESANWKERGYNELVVTSIPSLKTRVEILKSNVSSGLLKAANQSINVLFPILEKIKAKDAELDNINSQLAKLVEPAEKFITDKKGIFGNKNKEYTSEYSKYLAESKRLNEEASKLDKELKQLIESADLEINNIKALNVNVQNFDSTSDTGEISEVEGLLLTDVERELIAAVEDTIESKADEEGITYEEELTQVAGLYPTGKTILKNDAGGYEYGYSREIITSHGKIVKVFQQAWNDKSKKYRYTDMANDPKSLSSSGCGYNALASILSSVYPDITPEKLFIDMGKKSLYASTIQAHLLQKYGIKVGYRDDYPSTNPKNQFDETNKKDNLIKEVMKGNMVICTVGPGPDCKYTKQGHWVAIVDYDPTKDVFYITDSNDQDDSNAEPIDAKRFLRDYEINSNVIFIADESGYKARVNA